MPSRIKSKLYFEKSQNCFSLFFSQNLCLGMMNEKQERYNQLYIYFIGFNLFQKYFNQINNQFDLFSLYFRKVEFFCLIPVSSCFSFQIFSIQHTQCILQIVYFSYISYSFKVKMCDQLNKISEEKQKLSQCRWNLQEENFLKHLYENQKIRSWKIIAEKMNSKFPKWNRNSKQFRDRYINYLRYNLPTNELLCWSHQESSILFQKYAQFGPKWATIAKCLANKSQNCVKNRFYNSLRKYVRKINKILKQNRKNFNKKPIKFDAIIKILEFSKLLESSNGTLAAQWKTKKYQFNKIKQKMIRIIEACQNGVENTEEVIQNISQIIQFGKQTRFLIIGKRQKKKSQGFSNSSSVKPKMAEGLVESQHSDHLTKINSQVLENSKVEKKEADQKSFGIEIKPNSNNMNLELRLIDQTSFGVDQPRMGVWQSEISSFLNNASF